ncbi:MAG: cation diffusion facilitator family transporter [Methanobacterium sp.]
MGVIGSHLGAPFLDPLIALIIVVLVLRTAFEVTRNNINNIIGKVPSNHLLQNIEAAAVTVEGVTGTHSIKINYLGPYATVDIHIEVEPNLTVVEAHKISILVEKKII